MSKIPYQSKFIHGFPGYKVDTLGEVWSCIKQKHLRGTRGTYSYLSDEWKKLNPIHQNNGYLTVNLHIKGKKHPRSIHRLVLTAFNGDCPEKHQACHNNGNRKDNRLENLRWDTPRNNNADKVAHGTWQGGENHAMAKLNQFQVQRIRLMKEVEPTVTHREIAKKFMVSRHAICDILNKRTWSHI